MMADAPLTQPQRTDSEQGGELYLRKAGEWQRREDAEGAVHVVRNGLTRKRRPRACAREQ
jgi:hypothetical protein